MVPVKRTETFIAPGLYFEYNHFTQELYVSYSNMNVVICNDDSIEIYDVTKCQVSYSNVVKAVVLYYTGNGNWFERMENC